VDKTEALHKQSSMQIAAASASAAWPASTTLAVMAALLSLLPAADLLLR
jgi:uncharacterized membrane protein